MMLMIIMMMMIPLCFLFAVLLRARSLQGRAPLLGLLYETPIKAQHRKTPQAVNLVSGERVVSSVTTPLRPSMHHTSTHCLARLIWTNHSISCYTIQ